VVDVTLGSSDLADWVSIADDTVVISLPPGGELDEATGYEVVMDAGFITDKASLEHAGLLGNVPASFSADEAGAAPIKYLSFTVEDKSPPKALQFVPARGAVNVSTAIAQLSIAFDEPIVKGAGSIVVWKYDNANSASAPTQVAEMAIATDSRISVSGSTKLVVGLDTSILSSALTQYAVTITAGTATVPGSESGATAQASVFDAFGNGLGSIGADNSLFWSFTTAPDIIPPYIVSSLPRNGADVPPAGATSNPLSEIRMTMSEIVYLTEVAAGSTVVPGISIRQEVSGAASAANSTDTTGSGAIVRMLQAVSAPTEAEVATWPSIWDAPAPGYGSASAGSLELSGSNLILTLPISASAGGNASSGLFVSPNTRYAVLVDKSAVADSAGNELESSAFVVITTTEQLCTVPSECPQGSVCVDGQCQAPSCSDGLLNQDETDVDCGGRLCAGCSAGLLCSIASDCASKHCSNSTGTCLVATDSDGIQNGDEACVDGGFG